MLVRRSPSHKNSWRTKSSECRRMPRWLARPATGLSLTTFAARDLPVECPTGIRDLQKISHQLEKDAADGTARDDRIASEAWQPLRDERCRYDPAFSAGKRQRLDFQSVRLMSRQLQQSSRVVMVLKVIKEAGRQSTMGRGRMSATRTSEMRARLWRSSGTATATLTSRSVSEAAPVTGERGTLPSF